MYANGDYRITFMSSCPRAPVNLLDVVYARGGDQNLLSDNSFHLESNKWMNLAFVFYNNKLDVYQNSILKASATSSDDRPTFSNFFFDITNSEEGNFIIGSNSYENGNNIEAKYDNIRMYAAAAKSSAEVKAASYGYFGYELHLVSVTFDKEVIRIHQDYASANVGKTAIKYGPFVYCLEEADNGSIIRQQNPIISSDDEIAALYDDSRFSLKIDGVSSVSLAVNILTTVGYFNANEIELTFVPFAFRGNRDIGHMRVWINEG